MRYDVIIVGAGPAGSYAAYKLARQGLSVALCDKAAFPRDKPCGGAVSRKALALLPFALEPVVEAHVTGAWITHGGRAVFRDSGGNGPAVALTQRRALDAFLLEKARAQGADFLPEQAFVSCREEADGVVVRTAGAELTGRYLLAADGVLSPVRAAVFGRDVVTYAPAVEVLLEAPPHALARFSDRIVLALGAMPHGYGWIFGKRDHLSVGVYSTRGGSGIRGQLAAFVASHPPLAAAPVRERLGHPIPVRNRAQAFERGRVWLLGDAAGLAEAVLGEGIYFALKSADLAAGVFAATAAAPQPGDYTRCLSRELLPELAAAERLSRACYASPRTTFERIGRSRPASQLFLGLVTGEVGYRACVTKALAQLPQWLLAGREPAVPVSAIWSPAAAAP